MNEKFKNASKEELEEFIGAWNGEDEQFMFEGEIYTEYDVYEAEEILGNLNK